MFFLFSPFSCTLYCSFSTKSFLLLYKYVCYFLIPLVLNSLPTTLLFCTHSRPSKLAFSCSFIPIHSSVYLTSLSLLLRNCICQGQQWLPWSKLNGLFSVIASCDLSGTQHWGHSFFLKYLSWFSTLLVFFLSCCSSMPLVDSPSSPKSKLWTFSGFGLNWVSFVSPNSSLLQCFLVRVLWPFWVRQFFVVWDVLCIEVLLNPRY